MSEFKNVFIFVSDALRYGYLPDELIESSSSNVIRTLAPSHHSAKSFASILSGLEVSNHSVNHFGDRLKQDNILEMFEHSNLWDNEKSSIRYMLDLQENPDLDEMEEPFVWVERALETHIPYGKPGHDHESVEDVQEDYFSNYTDQDLKENYREAVDTSFQHFKKHLEYLKEEGLYEDTLIIFTADHGDALGERVFRRKRYGHNAPATKIVAEVPTIFYNYELQVDRMRSVDIVPTALNLIGKEWMMETDGVDIRREKPDRGECPTAPYIFYLEWEWSKSKEKWTMDKKSLAKALIEDHVPEKVFNKVGLEKKSIDFSD